MIARVRLYLGPEHLLQVTSNGYSETYKRFFFQDIQVISLHKTVAGTIGNVVWASLTVTFALLAALAGGGGAVVLGMIAAVWAALLILNFEAGPTCACYIQTAVQQQRLYSLNRVKRARRVIDLLKPLIGAAQGPGPAATDAPPAAGAQPGPAPGVV